MAHFEDVKIYIDKLPKSCEECTMRETTRCILLNRATGTAQKGERRYDCPLRLRMEKKIKPLDYNKIKNKPTRNVYEDYYANQKYDEEITLDCYREGDAEHLACWECCEAFDRGECDMNGHPLKEEDHD